MTDEKKTESRGQLSNRTVLIVFGCLALIFMLLFGVIGGWLAALIVPAAILVCILVMGLFNMLWGLLVFPTVALIALVVVRLSKGIKKIFTKSK